MSKSRRQKEGKTTDPPPNCIVLFLPRTNPIHPHKHLLGSNELGVGMMHFGLNIRAARWNIMASRWSSVVIWRSAAAGYY